MLMEHVLESGRGNRAGEVPVCLDQGWGTGIPKSRQFDFLVHQRPGDDLGRLLGSLLFPREPVVAPSPQTAQFEESLSGRCRRFVAQPGVGEFMENRLPGRHNEAVPVEPTNINLGRRSRTVEAKVPTTPGWLVVEGDAEGREHQTGSIEPLQSPLRKSCIRSGTEGKLVRSRHR